MAASDKDTIYIDIDDEITGIIDKLRSSDSKVVALVLPKRAAVFQSIVNMKLLKRAAESSKKHLVLITSEAGLLPLAGAAGVHVAKTLNSKPEIPAAPPTEEEEEAIEETGEEIDPDKPVGELAAAGAAGAAVAAAAKGDDVETIEIDDEDLPDNLDEKPKGSKKFDPPKKKKNKKLSVPNFERFRLLLILGGILLVFLIGGAAWAFFAMPKAVINIKTTATSVDVNLDLNLSTTATTVKPSTGTIPAKVVQQQKTYTQQVATTGQKNNGNKASGTIRLTNCSKQDGEVNIPAGSSFSSGGNTFISQEAVTLPESNFNNSGSRCTSGPSASVSILAQNPGAGYNGATSFAAGSPYGGVTGTGSTSGGTDNIVQTVNQNDINNAKAKININDPGVKTALQSQLKGQGQKAIDATFTSGTPTTTNSANVGEVATSVTVTETVTYTMFGVKEDDLKALVEADIRSQIDEEQSILDNGIDTAVYNVDSLSPTSAKLAMSTKATAGPDLDVDTIKQEAAGKKPGVVKSDLRNNPDVTEVDVVLSPFWVSSIPSKTERITVNIAKPADNAKANSSDGDNP